MSMTPSMEPILVVFGEGEDLTWWQMACRALVIFSIALVLIRASGRRSFGQHTAFDICVTVLLGAVLSRAVVGASPFWATVAGATAMALLHRLVALVCVRSLVMERWIAGREIEFARDGALDHMAMRNALVTMEDLRKEMRKRLGHEDTRRLRRALLERDGSITVVAE